MAENFLSPLELRRVVSGHIPALDGLRGVAILLVLFSHFAWVPITLTGFAGRLFVVTHVGWIGVELFFVLSGFLITGILIDSKTAENYFSSFYFRRALRILPLYYGTLFAAFILVPLLGKAGVPHLPRQFPHSQAWYWFYAGNWAWFWNHGVDTFLHFWSLAVEEQFYLVWPWVVLLTSRRTLARICILLVALGPVMRMLPQSRGVDPDLIYMSTFSYLDILALGALAALIVRDENWTRRVYPHLGKFIWPGLLIFILLGVSQRDFNNAGPLFALGMPAISIFFAALLLWAVGTSGSDSRLQRTLQTPWLRSYGKYSYAIYVFHGILLVPYQAILLPSLMAMFHNSPLRAWFYQRSALSIGVLGVLFAVNILGSCVLMLGIGKFSWWAFENPFNRLKSRFKVRWHSNNPSAAQSPYSFHDVIH